MPAAAGRVVQTLGKPRALHSHIAAARPALRSTAIRPPPVRLAQRSMSTQKQLQRAFGGPLASFAYTIGQIARMAIYFGLGIGAIFVIGFEGGHQYIEHFMMRDLPPGLLSAVDAAKDTWGWNEEETEESWGAPGNSGGTDSRLGLKGRHAIRAAFFIAAKGGGVAMPLNWGKLGGGQPSGMNVRSDWQSLSAEDVGLPMERDGMGVAEKILALAVAIGEHKGIKLPDIAAVRAGVATSHQAGADAPLDPTAIALETRLAGARERLGDADMLPLAIAGYERIYDALAATQGTNAVVEGSHSGQPHVPVSRLVRLARKLGDLNVSLDRKDEAEAWLLKAVELAGGRPGERKEAVLQEVAGVADADQTRGGWFSKWFGHTETEVQSQLQSQPQPPSPPTPTPTPSLTRSLVSALLSMSGLYASAPNASITSPTDPTWRSNLEEALRVQASTLRLIRFELERTAASMTSPTLGAELHTLWLRHNEALVSLHLAETMYGLKGSGGSNSSAGLIKRTLSRAVKTQDDNTQSLTWLIEARKCADQVHAQLVGVNKDKWSKDGDAAISIPASRLLRDSMRVKVQADRMIRALGGDVALAAKSA